jgi:hypothetical protein
MAASWTVLVSGNTTTRASNQNHQRRTRLAAVALQRHGHDVAPAHGQSGLSSQASAPAPDLLAPLVDAYGDGPAAGPNPA